MRHAIMIAGVFSIAAVATALAGPADKVDDAVWASLRDGQGEFLVRLVAQADVGGPSFLPTRGARAGDVVATLRATARLNQAPVTAWLDAQGASYRCFWIDDLILVRGDERIIRGLALRDDVARILANPSIRIGDVRTEVAADDQRFGARTIEPNIAHIGAPAVWATGNTGQGAVVGFLDTGVDWDHPALIRQYRGWDGHVAQHDGNWHDATVAHAAAPDDQNGHGTRAAGVAVGDDGEGTRIGVAPGARWIAARCLDNGWGTPAMLIECLEWMVAPYPVAGSPDDGDPSLAPDVVLTTWSCIPGMGCAWDTLLPAIVNVRAAGIVVVAIAGGSGPSCSTVMYPPEIYDESFTVGTTDNADALASFSGRGPVTADGSRRVKPDVVAPGISVRSASPGGGYEESTGASVAAPHVAGLVALVVTANPALRRHVDAIESLIAQTCVPRLSSQCGDGTVVPNNDYGNGRIDAAAACAAATTALATPPAPVTLACAPNPWNPLSTFRITLPAAGRVLLAIYDAAGRRVACLVDDTLSAGDHSIEWDGRAASTNLPSGIYLCRLDTPWGVRTTKMQLIR